MNKFTEEDKQSILEEMEQEEINDLCDEISLKEIKEEK